MNVHKGHEFNDPKTKRGNERKVRRKSKQGLRGAVIPPREKAAAKTKKRKARKGGKCYAAHLKVSG